MGAPYLSDIGKGTSYYTYTTIILNVRIQKKPTATVSATEKIKLGKPNTMKWYFYINEELTGTCCQLR